MLKELDLKSVEDLAGWLYKPNHSVDQVAKLSRVLWRCVQTGDRVADRILVEASKELALLVKSVLQKAKLGNMACSIYLNGGAVVHASRLVGEIEEKVKISSACQLIVSTTPSTN